MKAGAHPLTNGLTRDWNTSEQRLEIAGGSIGLCSFDNSCKQTLLTGHLFCCLFRSEGTPSGCRVAIRRDSILHH